MYLITNTSYKKAMKQRKMLKKQTAMILAFVMVVMCFLPLMPKTIVEAASNGKLVKINGNWCYTENGKVNKNYAGMAKNEYGWWYVGNGTINYKYTGMAKNEYGWWYMKNGKLDNTYTGMAKNEYGWWYMKNGKLDKTYTGMAKNQYGWWYMKNGKLDKTYTGMAKNQYGWWYMTNGKLDNTYTGIAVNAYGMWYMKNGKLDTTYTGEAKYKGRVYNVEKGKVVSAKDGVENIEFTVWCPAEYIDSGWIKNMCEKFNAEHPYWDINFTYEICSESNVVSYVAMDPAYAGDIYFFASDQLTRLINYECILELEGEAAEYVKKTNSETMVSTVTQDGSIYGIPHSANTWFMYYDKRVFTKDDVKSLETMLSKGKVAFPLTNSWYFQAFYTAVGATFNGTNGDDDAAGIVLGKNGTAATKYLVNLVKNPNFVVDDGGTGIIGLKDGSVNAMFSGVWDYENVCQALGKENVGICQLPTIKVEGKDYSLKAFLLSRDIGVNPYSDNKDVAVELAQYLASEEAQLACYEVRGVVPCNTKLLATDALKRDELVQAVGNTVANTAIVQPSELNINWWNYASYMARSILNGSVSEENAAEWTEMFETNINAR